jgi:DHA3 family macrolide efflux protein-like MFS transporter
MEMAAGIGIIVGGLAIAAVPLGGRKIIVLLVSFALSCAAVALAALAPSTMLWLAVVWWGISGVTFSTGNAPLMALLQTQVPNHIQGRVLSLLTTVTGLAAPIGLALAAVLGEPLGVRGLFILGGGLSAVICLLGLLAPSLMRLESTPIVVDEAR